MGRENNAETENFSGSNVDRNRLWADDVLGRAFCAKTLTNFLKNQNSALTVALNGSWGTGKTFFLERWKLELKAEGYEVVYFNAWRDDCLRDPLIAIIGQLLMSSIDLDSEKSYSELKASAGRLIKNISVSLLRGMVEKKFGSDIIRAAEETLNSEMQNALDEYVSQIKTREDFQEKLRAFADKVFEKTGNPLVFIVDELDRCRPDFAVKVLERIKHIFSIDHVVFVLGIDREQLGHVIRAVYGEIDVDNYLLRFIDIDFCLPEINYQAFFNTVWKNSEISSFLDTRIKNLPAAALFLGSPIVGDVEAAAAYLKDIFALHHFTLREVESGVKLYGVVMKSSSSQESILPELLPILLLLKSRNRDLYRKFLELKCSLDELLRFVFPSPINSSSKEENRRKVVLLSAIFSIFRNSGLPEVSQEELVLQEIERKVSHGKSYIFKLLPDTTLRDRFRELVVNVPEFHFEHTQLVDLVQRMDLIINKCV